MNINLTSMECSGDLQSNVQRQCEAREKLPVVGDEGPAQRQRAP
jgi:hypothetical protein